MNDAASKKTIRVGDCVRIVEPCVFERCGYPMSYEESIDKAKQKYGLEMDKFHEAVDGDIGFKIALEREISRLYMRQNRYGGPERKIFTTPKQELSQITGIVQEKFNVVTGVYSPGQTWGVAYSEDYDCDPPGLFNAKVHTILRLNLINTGLPNTMVCASHVEKLRAFDLISSISPYAQDRDPTFSHGLNVGYPPRCYTETASEWTIVREWTKWRQFSTYHTVLGCILRRKRDYIAFVFSVTNNEHFVEPRRTINYVGHATTCEQTPDHFLEALAYHSCNATVDLTREEKRKIERMNKDLNARMVAKELSSVA